MSDLFQLFDLPATFSIDEQALEQRYQALIAHCHPDRYASASALEQRVAAKRAADINDAYQILIHPVSRGRHLLELAGVDTQALERQPADPEFLFEQLMRRERVQDFTSLDDDEAAELVDDVRHQYHHSATALGTSLDANDVAVASSRWVELNYHQKLHDELEQALNRQVGR